MMAGEDDWQPVQAAAQPAAGDDWQPVGSADAAPAPAAGQPTSAPEPDPSDLAAKLGRAPDFSAPGMMAAVRQTSIGDVARAFWTGAQEGAGPEPLGFSQDSMNWLIKNGIFRKEDKVGSVKSAFQAFAEGVFYPLAAGLDAAARTPGALYRGAQAAVAKAGEEVGAPTLGRDIASIPDAFLGSPGMLHAPEATAAERAGQPEAAPVAASDMANAPIKEAPIVQFRRDAAEIEQRLPPVDDGLTRLWRGNRPGEVGQNPVFTSDLPGIALPFRKSYGGDLSYVDVPTADLSKYENTAGTATNAEFTLPEELAGQAKLAAESPPPAKPAVDLVQAREMGVIGPERPAISEGTPEDAGRLAGPPAAPPDAQPPGSPGAPPEQPSEWRQRFEATLDKMETPADAKALIMNAVDRNNEFQTARQGKLPPQQLSDLAEATGLDSAKIDPEATGRLVKTNDQMRNIVQALRSLDDKIVDISQQIAGKAGANDEAEIEALSRLQMQRNMIVDQSVEPFVAFRAEFGRAGNVLQEFMKLRRDGAELGDALKAGGQSVDDMRDLAKMMANTPKEAAASVMAAVRKPAPPGVAYWGWQQGLISGWLTHSKYAIANTLSLAAERGVVTPLAAMIGKAKEITGLAGPDVDRVFMGETAAGSWGMIHSVPTSVMAAARSFKAGVPVALESETKLFEMAVQRNKDLVAAGERPEPIPPKIARAVAEMQPERPISGVWGRIAGAPGDAASSMHILFKTMGEQASLASVTYRQAMKEGLTPGSDAFNQRWTYHRANPSEAMLNEARADAYRGTFMSELGPAGKAWARVTKTVPGLKWLFPFNHIPLNLMKATYESSPFALASVMKDDSELGAAIRGERGGIAQDKAIARMVVGSSIMGYLAYKAMSGQATGDYPTDPKERDAWKLAGKQPNSMLLGDYWVSFNKFGPAGDLANIGANIAQVIHSAQKPDDDAFTEATWRAAKTAAHVVADEVGFQSLSNLFEAMQDEKKGVAWAASTASSFLPYSSFVSQTASFNDPYMRDTKSFVDGLKYRVPMLRETLMPKRDVLGDPIENPQYGNIIRKRHVLDDPVRQELATLQIPPAPPQDRISGVKLTPSLYDNYQVVAGSLAKQTLGALVNSPGWSGMPDYVRETAMRHVLEGSRKAAGATMMAAHPEIIQAAMKQRLDHIQGTTHTDRPKRSPVSLETAQ